MITTTRTEEEGTKRRDRHDIIVEILKAAINGKVKTNIMYNARLSYTQLNEYLPKLVEKGFLKNLKTKRKKDYKNVFQTTSKGLKLLENLENIRSLWSLTDNSYEEQVSYKNS
jgi:predicted transcriptional regulator